MANPSIATGTYHFDFTGTNIATNSPAKEAFINNLHCLTTQYAGDGEYREYYTDFDIENLDTADYQKQIVEVSFYGCGRRAYHNNLEWFKTNDEISKLLKSIKGLVIEIIYTDVLESEYCEGKATVVMDGAGEQLVVEEEKLT